MLACIGQGWAQDAREPVRTPFLMIDAEMHVGAITRVAVDAQPTIVATGSVDKSIRLFDAADGRYLRKFILPLDDGLIGSITGLAMTPDGKRLLAGTVSFDTGDGFDEGSLYLIDTASGDLLGRIKQLPAAPSEVRFSPDGSRLALTFAQLGFEVRTAQGKQLFRDLRSPVAALAIGNERLVTISDEAEVHVFVLGADKADLQRSITLDDAGQPSSVALSPDGRRLAVGYLDKSFVDVVDLQGKGNIRLLPPRDLADGNLATVAQPGRSPSCSPAANCRRWASKTCWWRGATARPRRRCHPWSSAPMRSPIWYPRARMASPSPRPTRLGGWSRSGRTASCISSCGVRATGSTFASCRRADLRSAATVAAWRSAIATRTGRRCASTWRRWN